MKTFKSFNQVENLDESTDKIKTKLDPLINELSSINNKLLMIPKDTKDNRLKKELTHLSNEIKDIIRQYDTVLERIENSEY